MFRELAQIVLAIHLSSPHLPVARANSYAHVMQTEADKIDIDPIVLVAIAQHESQFNERAISPDREDWGLLQIRARFYGGQAEWLLNGEHNIRVGSYVIKVKKDFCRNRLHREPTTQEWLSLFQGTTHLCKPNKLTKLVDDYANCLQEAVTKNPEDGPAPDCRKIYYGANSK